MEQAVFVAMWHGERAVMQRMPRRGLGHGVTKIPLARVRGEDWLVARETEGTSSGSRLE
jgi:hypothetical protein